MELELLKAVARQRLAASPGTWLGPVPLLGHRGRGRFPGLPIPRGSTVVVSQNAVTCPVRLALDESPREVLHGQVPEPSGLRLHAGSGALHINGPSRLTRNALVIGNTSSRLGDGYAVAPLTVGSGATAGLVRCVTRSWYRRG